MHETGASLAPFDERGLSIAMGSLAVGVTMSSAPGGGGSGKLTSSGMSNAVRNPMASAPPALAGSRTKGTSDGSAAGLNSLAMRSK
jgi:F0F1-type ATP synthase membrane subunit c/vacuolar-type H+-ATPase subunit K